MDNIRKARIENEIREKLSLMIASGQIKDPRVGVFASITRVELTRDLSLAKIYVSSLFEAESQNQILVGLKKASGFIRSKLAQSLRLRRMPDLRFILDESASDSFRLVRKLESLVDRESIESHEEGQ